MVDQEFFKAVGQVGPAVVLTQALGPGVGRFALLVGRGHQADVGGVQAGIADGGGDGFEMTGIAKGDGDGQGVEQADGEGCDREDARSQW